MDLERLRYYTEWYRVANERTYEAPADPWALVRVDPEAVRLHNQQLRLNWGLGRVQGGDWDREGDPIRETTTYRGLRQRFAEGRDWEDTALYRRVAEQFEDRDAVRGYGSLQEFLNVRCAYVDDLYRSIARDGYRPNEAADHERATDENAFEDAYVHHLEPLVVVGRDGELQLTEGFHRFSIADLLGLEELPVQVLCRHVEWQRVRGRIATGAATPAEAGVDPDHPDLADLR